MAAASGDGNSSAEIFRCLVRKSLPPCNLIENLPLKQFTTLRIGGPARFFCEPRNLDELRVLLRRAGESGLRHSIIGAGSNLLVDDSGFHGLILRLRGNFWESQRIGEKNIYVRCGLPMKRLSIACCSNCIGGYEFCDGIPGTIGGAIAMNAGAFSSAMGDFVEKITALGRDGKIVSICGGTFSYRKSPLRHGDIVLAATLKRPADLVPVEMIIARRDQMSAERRKKQPREPSAGSIFRNPPATSAGKLIDEAGLKGTRIGDAQISLLHGNFIVNRGHATCAQVLELIFLAKRTVMERFGVDLVPEICFLTDSWEGPL
ncbi:MAG: UDP-N-acetylmuramate dehydrogenase [Puniceicoccales bacterium]|jgi:UDP-N-acetylenolpyruvoylglucosamine reductase|nr:UDP-N-acetylmuramate dehydrogenase [Puniceicoccales bacterium]